MGTPKPRMGTIRLLCLSLLAAFFMTIAIPAYSRFVKTVSVPNTITTATLHPPTTLFASASCDGGGTAKVTLGWAETLSTFADGYDIYRSSTDGAPYAKIDRVIGRTTTAFANQGLAVGTTYFYIVRSTANNWTSVDSDQAQATTPASCA